MLRKIITALLPSLPFVNPLFAQTQHQPPPDTRGLFWCDSGCFFFELNIGESCAPVASLGGPSPAVGTGFEGIEW
jgi:hypothetical protein